MNDSKDDYLLGVNKNEFERLQFQHSVWREVTEKFFDRLNIQKGWKCLDVGAGPGFVSIDLRKRIGENGEVTALEPSEFYLNWLKNESEKNGWENLKFIQGTVETIDLPEHEYDFIFVRWVIAFVPDQELFVDRLVKALKRGGIIAFQDYYYEGLSLFPKGGAWDRMADFVRAYYRSGGGDPYVTGKLPGYFRKRAVELIDFTPTSRAGGPTSSIMEWAHRFFITHTQMMADHGIFSQADCDALLDDWNEHRENPDAIFFAPIVVDVAGRKR